MSQFSVNETPQGIFPDGQNQPAVITNLGPAQIYLDSISSVSEFSHPLPPNGTIVWDQNRPLWVRSDPGGSSIRMTLNSRPSEANRSHVDTVIYENAELPPSVQTAIMDVGSYESVEVVVEPNIFNTSTVVDSAVTIRFYWFVEYSTDLTQAIAYDVELLAPVAPTLSVSARQTVQGRFLILLVEQNAPSPAVQQKVIVTGSTRQNLAERTASYFGREGTGLILFNSLFTHSDVRKDAQSYIGAAGSLFTTLSTFYFCRNSPSGEVRVMIRAAGAVGTGTLLTFRSVFNNITFATINIPASGAAQNIDETLWLPPFVPIKITATPNLVMGAAVSMAIQTKG